MSIRATKKTDGKIKVRLEGKAGEEESGLKEVLRGFDPVAAASWARNQGGLELLLQC